MDEPVHAYYERLPEKEGVDIWAMDLEKIHSFEYALNYVIDRDKKDDFVKLIKMLKRKEDFLTETMSETLRYLLNEDCYDTLGAVIAGETGEIFTLDFCKEQVAAEGRTLLHAAAAEGARPRTIALLLENGFAADVNTLCNCEVGVGRGRRRKLNDRVYKEVLPLHLALDAARDNTVFRSFLNEYNTITPAELVINLCKNYLRFVLESVRILARKTKNIRQEFLQYLTEGKMIEVGVLLLVAHKQLLDPSLSEGEHTSFSSTLEMHRYLLEILAEDLKSMSPAEFESRKGELMEKEVTLGLLKIFDKMGDKLTAYVQQKREKVAEAKIVEEVTVYLQEAGFPVAHEKKAYKPEVGVRTSEISFLWKESNKHRSMKSLEELLRDILYRDTYALPQHSTPISGLSVAMMLQKPSRGQMPNFPSNRRNYHVPSCKYKFPFVLSALRRGLRSL